MGAMGSRTKVGVAALAAVALIGLGAVGAGAIGGGATEAPPPRAAGTASPTESVFVPMTPCRIVNTQNSAGNIDAGELRSYKTNGNTSEQGGAASCGIPTSATALELSVSAVSAQGPGYLRVHPAGVATPTATFLNYGPAQNITNAGTVSIRPGANQTNLSVRAYEADTHVVIDVLGYYVSELFAVVDAPGTLARGNGVVSVANPFSGVYDLVFDRNVSGCTYLVSPGGTGANQTTAYDVAASRLDGNANGVRVQTKDPGGLNTDEPFHLVVDC
jgi:hypothetical protein